MDANRFDSLLRTLPTAASRRRVLVGALGSALGLGRLIARDEAEAG